MIIREHFKKKNEWEFPLKGWEVKIKILTEHFLFQFFSFPLTPKVSQSVAISVYKTIIKTNLHPLSQSNKLNQTKMERCSFSESTSSLNPHAKYFLSTLPTVIVEIRLVLRNFASLNNLIFICKGEARRRCYIIIR